MSQPQEIITLAADGRTFTLSHASLGDRYNSVAQSLIGTRLLDVTSDQDKLICVFRAEPSSEDIRRAQEAINSSRSMSHYTEAGRHRGKRTRPRT